MRLALAAVWFITAGNRLDGDGDPGLGPDYVRTFVVVVPRVVGRRHG